MDRVTCNYYVNETIETVKSLLGVDLGNVDVSFFRNSKIAGQACLNRNNLSLRFNEDFMERLDDCEFKDTIIHEVSHLVVYRAYPNAKQAHGPQFKMICSYLGGSGKTYHNYSTEGMNIKTKKTTRYEYVCNCGKTLNISTTMFRRISNGDNRVCPVCRSRVVMKNFTGKTIIRK